MKMTKRNHHNPNDSERDSIQTERQSVLDMLESKNQAALRKTILHRIIVVSKLRNFENKTKLGEYYDKMFRNQTQPQAGGAQANANSKAQNPFFEKVTGILIIYPTLAVQIIESSLETIKSFLTDIEIMHNDTESGMIAESRIISMSHEIHVRLYPVYTFKMMNLSLEHDSSEPTESTETLVTDMVTKLLRMGKFLNDQYKIQLKKETIDNLHENHPEFLPNQNIANFLVRCDQLQTPKEYLSYYTRAFNISLESDSTWPAPNKLFPYQ